MKIGSLFSGYGGLDIAVESFFHAETVWHAEWEGAPSKVLAHHWPGVPNFRDVTQVDWSAVEPVDIITGGFPCQDVSTAGKRAGMVEGTRSNLWGAMRTAVETIRPRYVVAENVRGLLSATAQSDSDLELDQGFMGDGTGDNLRAIGRVLGDLADIGYDAKWYGLRAADIGAPHNRFRVFILATNTTNSGQLIRAIDDVPKHTRATGIRSGIASSTRSTGPHRARVAWEASANTIDNGRWRLERCTVPQGQPDTQDTSKSGTIRTRIPERADTGTAWGAYEPAIRRWETIIGRPAPEPTEPTGRDGKPQLSAKFTEWVMGLDEGWVTGVPDVSRANQIKMCGNGVVPQQAYEALRRMKVAG